MRLSVCLSVLLGVLASLLVAVPAEAKIKPIPRPEKVIPKESATGVRAAIAPIVKPAIRAKPAVRKKPVVHRKPVAHKKPVVHKKPVTHKKPVVHTKRVVRTRAVVHATRAVHVARATTRHRPAGHVRRHVIHLTHRHGGRKVAPAASWGGRRAPPPPLPVKPPVPDPTPLDLVGIREALPAPVPAWPAWVFSVLGALAVGEAVVLIQLVRGRRLSPSV
jgi:hypothetical protein